MLFSKHFTDLLNFAKKNKKHNNMYESKVVLFEE